MPLNQKEQVIQHAVKKFQKEKEKGNKDYTSEDALVFSLEEFDTGYDLTSAEYDELKESCASLCHKDLSATEIHFSLICQCLEEIPAYFSPSDNVERLHCRCGLVWEIKRPNKE